MVKGFKVPPTGASGSSSHLLSQSVHSHRASSFVPQAPPPAWLVGGLRWQRPALGRRLDTCVLNWGRLRSVNSRGGSERALDGKRAPLELGAWRGRGDPGCREGPRGTRAPGIREAPLDRPPEETSRLLPLATPGHRDPQCHLGIRVLYPGP